MNARAVVFASAGLLALALVCVSASASSTLTVPAQPQAERTDGSTVWFQGYLADSVTGDPLTGSYNIVAAIYTQESGGAPVWGPEAHNGTQVLEGWFHIELGSIVTPFLDFSAPPYYLQLTVSGEVLSPRQKLASVPAAIRSGDDGDWVIDGDDLYHPSGTVYVGLPLPFAGARSEAEGGKSSPGSRDGMALRAYNEDGYAVYGAVMETNDLIDGRTGVFGFRNRTVSAPGSGYLYGGTNNAVAGYNLWGDPYTFGVAGYCYNDYTRTGGVLGAEWDGSPWGALGYKDEASAKWGVYTPDAVYVGGNLGVGTTTPSSKLDVAGTARMTGFAMPTGAVGGRVLMSDGSGNGTWQPAPGTIGGSGTAGYVPKFTAATTLANSGLYDSGSGIGIGTTSPSAKLTVQGGTSGPLLDVVSTYTGEQDYVMKVQRTNVGTSFDDVLRVQMQTTGADYQQYALAIRNEGGGAVFHVNGDGYMVASDGATFGNSISAMGDHNAGVFSASEPSSDTQALIGEFTSNPPADGVGVYGQSVPGDYFGIGGRFQGGWIGVDGKVVPTGAYTYVGVKGSADGGSGANTGVMGSASGSWVNYGVYGQASGGITNYAGYFDGAVHATGGYTWGRAGMKIDDPRDPANRYLCHSSVGSDEMLNVYSGNVMLDGTGEARVELPDWFETLNGDFRYQLTCIGAFAPVYVAEKIAGGGFTIAGGEPGMEVSWQVTGVRHDPVALAQRKDVVQEKPAPEMGKYVNPDAYGMPASTAVGYAEEK